MAKCAECKELICVTIGKMEAYLAFLSEDLPTAVENSQVKAACAAFDAVIQTANNAIVARNPAEE